ncbi:MAG: restriction endonuclease [Thermoplasmata archaeon]|nr:restriction endonuclease [Thermoplasmata archaeon]
MSSDSAKNPWVDIIESDEGFALYNGDNKSAEKGPFEVDGNKAILSVANLYGGNRSARERAPPFLVFRQVETGVREFCGYGVPVRLSLRTQRNEDGGECFLNLVIELTLFDLPDVDSPHPSDGELDWQWINDRRNAGLTTAQANGRAPPAWRTWLREGDPERCRRSVLKSRIRAKIEQSPGLPSESEVLKSVYDHYQGRQHEFEGLAARITAQVIGERCIRKWVTRRSSDGGVDFVNLLKVGDPQSRAAVVVLGQAKCIALDSAVDAKDLARLVARLRRGWIGSFVTTGSFTEPAQGEVIIDGYPLLLVPGKVVAREVRKLAASTGGLPSLLNEEEQWYRANVHDWPPSRAADDAYFGVDLPVLRRTED